MDLIKKYNVQLKEGRPTLIVPQIKRLINGCKKSNDIYTLELTKAQIESINTFTDLVVENNYMARFSDVDLFLSMLELDNTKENDIIIEKENNYAVVNEIDIVSDDANEELEDSNKDLDNSIQEEKHVYKYNKKYKGTRKNK